ncbi:MAG: 4a-hydroxytetrahydrobiopterin dehydratase [Fimbriimonadaceae bacterium]|nr:4a-hydroxytetrahydrobiopterin dehydratase [Fimbriimonadaceae bacterium]
MELAYVLLSDRELLDALAGLRGWSVYEGKLVKTFQFSAYTEGLAFACAIGHVAERLNHHPDLLVGYRKVTVAIVTHDVGGLSPYDVELARRIDLLG